MVLSKFSYYHLIIKMVLSNYPKNPEKSRKIQKNPEKNQKKSRKNPENKSKIIRKNKYL